MKLTELKAGYLLLWKIGMERRGFKAFISKLIGFFQPAIGEGGSLKKTYSHIAMVDNATTMMLESTWPKSRKTKIELSKSPYTIEVYKVKRADEICFSDGINTFSRRDIAIKWCYDHLGKWYDIPQLLSMGLINVKNAEVCSTFVGKAWLQAGIVLSTEGMKDSLISPNEIVENKIEVEYIDKLEE